jgi:hypothetical protein
VCALASLWDGGVSWRRWACRKYITWTVLSHLMPHLRTAVPRRTTGQFEGDKDRWWYGTKALSWDQGRRSPVQTPH